MDGNAHILQLPTVMDRCLSRAVRGQLLHNQADKDNEVDTGGVVDEPADVVDSKAVERVADSQVDERASVINHIASEGGNVESQSVDGDTDASDDCPAARSSPPARDRCKKSRACPPSHTGMQWLIVVSTCPNWLQRSDKVI